MMKLKDIEVRGKKFAVAVDELRGTFHATVGERRLSAHTLDELITRVTTATKVTATRVAVEATRLGHRRGRDVEHIVMTGLHASDGRVLYRDAKGHAGKIEGFTDDVARRLTDAEVAQFKSLVAAKLAADQQFDAFVARVRIDARKVVQEAVSKASGVPIERLR